MGSKLRLSIIAVLLLSTTALGIIGYNAMQPAPLTPTEPDPIEPTVVQERELCSHLMDEAVIERKKRRSREDPTYGPGWQPPWYCGTRDQLEKTAAYLNGQIGK